MHKDEIVTLKVKDIIPYARNNKIHGEKQIRLLKSAIQESGYDVYIVVDEENVILKGHARHEAITQLDWEEVKCIKRYGLSKTDKKYIRIADNKLSSLAEWDNEMLQLELQELEELDFDLELTGFDDSELNDFLGIDIDDIDTSDEFSLPDGDKAPFQQMTFTLADSQAEFIKEAIRKIKEEKTEIETFGNENGNGNALYGVVLQWEELRK